MEYEKRVSFTGRGGKALEVARSTFIPLGFQITTSTDRELRATGPGISSTRESPLKGISETSIVVSPLGIEMKADFGGVRKLQAFLKFFPLGMAVLFLLVFGVLAYTLPDFRRWWIFLIPLLALSPWLFLSPMISRQIERRTSQAIDTLLSNMVMLASD